MEQPPSDHLVRLVLSAQMTGCAGAVCLLSRRDVQGKLALRPVPLQAQLERRGHAGYKVVIKRRRELVLFPVRKVGQRDNGLVLNHLV